MTLKPEVENMTLVAELETVTLVAQLENVTSGVQLDNMTSVAELNNTMLDSVLTMNASDTTAIGPSMPFLSLVAKVLIVIGLLANILTMVVMTTKDSRKVTISRLLLALAISDSVCLCCNSLNSENVASFVPAYVTSLVGCKVYFWFRLTFALTSHWLVLLISVERLIAVCFPLKARQINTDTKAYMSVAIILCVAATYVSIMIMQWQGVHGTCIFANIQGASVPLYTVYGAAYILLLIPLLIVSNCVTAFTLCSKPHGQIKHRNLTIMLLSTTAFFILLVSPGVIVFSPKYSASPRAKAVTQFLINVNYAGNFFVYVLVGKRFRRNMRLLFWTRGNAVAPQLPSQSDRNPQTATATARTHKGHHMTTITATRSEPVPNTTRSEPVPHTTVSEPMPHTSSSEPVPQTTESESVAMKNIRHLLEVPEHREGK